MKWICGFANAQGGKIFIGIDDKGETGLVPPCFLAINTSGVDLNIFLPERIGIGAMSNENIFSRFLKDTNT